MTHWEQYASYYFTTYNNFYFWLYNGITAIFYTIFYKVKIGLHYRSFKKHISILLESRLEASSNGFCPVPFFRD